MTNEHMGEDMVNEACDAINRSALIAKAILALLKICPQTEQQIKTELGIVFGYTPDAIDCEIIQLHHYERKIKPVAMESGVLWFLNYSVGAGKLVLEMKTPDMIDQGGVAPKPIEEGGLANRRSKKAADAGVDSETHLSRKAWTQAIDKATTAGVPFVKKGGAK